LNFGQTIWDKTQVQLGTSWGMHLGTLWELITVPAPLKKKEEKRNWMVHECMLSLLIACMKFLFPKLLVTIFGLG